MQELTRRQFLGLLTLIGCNEDMLLNQQIFAGQDRTFLDKVTHVVAVGDSITVGSNASTPTTNGYVYLLRSRNGISTIGNGAVSGRGVWNGINQLNNGSIAAYTRATSLLVAMCGLNDIRRNGSASKTLKKIEACHRSFIAKHFAVTNIAARDAAVTKTGTTANYDAQPLGGNLNLGQFSSTSLASWEYTFTGTKIGVSLLAQDGVVSTSWGTSKIYIDGNLVETFSHSGVWFDGVSDGSFGNYAGPVARWYFGLSDASHTIKVEAQSTAPCIIDFFFIPSEPADIGPMLFFEIPYLDATGYATSPSSGSTAASDAASAVISSIVDEVARYGYRIRYVPTNSYYVLGSGLDTDHIHPNNTGHIQIADAGQSKVV